MPDHQPHPTEVDFRSWRANEVVFGETDHDLARHTLAWCDLEDGKFPTELLDQLLKQTRTSSGIPGEANLGWMLSQCLRSREAVNRLNKDINENPDSEELKLYAAICLQRARDFRTSQMVLEEILSTSPQNLLARHYYFNALMNLGKWPEGFVEREKARGDLTPLQAQFCANISRLWMGQDITGKNIVVVGNDHLGDQIQFARYINELRKLNPDKIGYACSPELVEPMRSLQEVNRVDSVLFNPFHYFVPVGSLPYRLGATPDTIPTGKFLSCNQTKAAEKRQAFFKGKPLLGVCWRNHQFPVNDKACNRYDERANSIDLPLLKTHLQTLAENYDIVAIQQELRPAERELLSSCGITFTGQEEFQNYAKIAELVSSLDVLVTVDAPVAHLAGAIGFNHTHVLLPFLPEWKWSAETGTSKWYPDSTIHRKTSEHSWEECLKEVSAELTSELSVNDLFRAG